MNTSFSTKEGKSATTSPTFDNNLPTISQTTKPDSESKQENGDKTKGKNVETIPKRQKLKREAGPTIQKLKTVNEYIKLKQNGDLKYLPKLCIDVPMTAQRFKFADVYFENDGKWIYRMISRDEYVRKDQIKNLESGKIPKLIYDNSEKSPYYNETSIPYYDEKKLIPTKENESSYQQQRLKNRGFRRAIVSTGVPKKDKIYTELNPFYKPLGEHDNTLVFESRFECGNLKRAMLVDEYEYDLLMQSDYNSPGYSQWFYFKVSNTRANTRYIFNLSHFYKPESLYNCGMKPLMYSTKKAKNEGIGWSRIGDDICYYQNCTKKKAMVGFLYTLSFSFELPYDNDEVFFCHSFPYTYRDCKDHLDKICVDIK